MIIFGSILSPFVSSSKNLSKHALDAGSGAFFFLPSAILVLGRNGKDKNFFNLTLFLLLRLLTNQWILSIPAVLLARLPFQVDWIIFQVSSLVFVERKLKIFLCPVFLLISFLVLYHN